MATVTVRGTTCNLKGEMPKPGQSAPGFRLTRSDLCEVTLDTLGKKKKVIVTVPSLDTPVCAMETKKFNEKAAELSNVALLIVSSDLPFAQKRFCAAENIDAVQLCSDLRDRDFAERYGVAITDGPLEGIMARAVVVLDSDNRVTHSQLVGEIAEEPDYEAVLAALA